MEKVRCCLSNFDAAEGESSCGEDKQETVCGRRWDDESVREANEQIRVASEDDIGLEDACKRSKVVGSLGEACAVLLCKRTGNRTVVKALGIQIRSLLDWDVEVLLRTFGSGQCGRAKACCRRCTSPCDHKFDTS